MVAAFATSSKRVFQGKRNPVVHGPLMKSTKKCSNRSAKGQLPCKQNDRHSDTSTVLKYSTEMYWNRDMKVWSVHPCSTVTSEQAFGRQQTPPPHTHPASPTCAGGDNPIQGEGPTCFLCSTWHRTRRARRGEAVDKGPEIVGVDSREATALGISQFDPSNIDPHNITAVAMMDETEGLF